jgi:hypothetical protein
MMPQPAVIGGRGMMYGLESIYNTAMGNGLGTNPNPTAQFL